LKSRILLFSIFIFSFSMFFSFQITEGQFQQSDDKPKCPDGYRNAGTAPWTCFCDGEESENIPQECLEGGYPVGIPQKDENGDIYYNSYRCYEGWHRNQEDTACKEGVFPLPQFLKNPADWWADELILDSEYYAVNKFVVDNGFQIPQTFEPIEVDELRDYAKWWSDGSISDTDYTQALKTMEINNLFPTDPTSGTSNIIEDKALLVGVKTVWQNNDNVAHTVTSGTWDSMEGHFDSSLIQPGEKFEVLLESGVYPYFCMIHPWNTGTVTVVQTEQEDISEEESEEEIHEINPEFMFNRTKFYVGETLTMSGVIEDGKRATQVDIILTKPDGTTKELKIFVTSGGHYTTSLVLDSSYEVGEYNVLSSYQSRVLGKETFSLEAKPKTTPEETKIPEWVRGNAGWWAQGTIGDSDFVSGIQYLIKKGIMTIPETAKAEGVESKEIPSWIKNNADWWSQGLISDDDFVKGIQYLVEQGIIQV
jgi:hypothetical protein